MCGVVEAVEMPDILRSGLPVFWFDELEQLGMVKTMFSTGRVLQ